MITKTIWVIKITGMCVKSELAIQTVQSIVLHPSNLLTNQTNVQELLSRASRFSLF